ncbi:MAG: hypothetical protein OHK93_004197 [Ramalina farinacea]|uniref:Uncharacterized protein n=1 Tax=Ramalina farinacea TaxID=258253 RepID=A0AA43QJU2_9LECA|nr:hypothetical protein [Ramalina farinacea]
MTRQGRLAVLTNFREEGAIKPGPRSRGLLPNLHLTRSIQDGQGTEDFVSSLIERDGLQGIGGFSLVCGQVGEPIAVISNRTPNVKDITWITKTRGETVGLSNANIADRSWTKVTRGETLVQDVIHQSVSAKGSKESLVEALFDVLSDDALPRDTDGKSWESRVRELRKSIFIPAVGGRATKKESAEDLAAAKEDDHTSLNKPHQQDPKQLGMSGTYGTQKQTIVLVSHGGHVTFIERSLYGNEPLDNSETQDRVFEFDIGS